MSRPWFDAALRSAALGTMLCVSLAARPALAQSILPTEHTALTLPRTLSLADAAAPDRMIAAARLAVAHADVGVASMLTNPTVIAGGAINTAHFFTAIAIPVPLFGQIGAARAVASALETAARHDVDVTRLDVRLAASLSWIDLWLGEHEVLVATESADRAERLAGVTRERFDAGAAPRLDVLRARAESLRLRAEADSATLTLASIGARLALWICADAQSTLRTAGEPGGASVPSLATLLGGMDHHPLLLAAHTRTSAAEANVSLERRRRWPIVGLELGTSFLDPSLSTSALQPVPAFADAHVAVSFEIPFFHVHGPLIARAQAAVSQSSYEAASVRRRLEVDLAAAYAEWRAADARARAQHGAVLPAATEAAELALEAYRAGRLDITGVLAAQQVLTDAQRATFRIDAEVARAAAVLAHAGGIVL